MGITFKSIDELLKGENGKKYKFTIPDYQRGYRWKEKQVKDFLNDIKKYFDAPKKGIYCLQPLVVKVKNENEKEVEYNVVDGQQRLTTIFILLKCLLLEPSYSISYDTRSGSSDYLINITSHHEDKSNIDFYYMNTVYDAIQDWLKKNKGFFDEERKRVFKEKVKFIWYTVNENEQAVFERLNAGKIPLNSAELVKALLLNRTNFVNKKEKDPDQQNYKEKVSIKQRRISTNWDTIENALQNDEFWYFINNGEKNKSARMNFILDLMCNTDSELKDSEDLEDSEENKSFRYFEEYFKKNEANEDFIEKTWKKIRNIYLTLDEWYNDFELYHYIGFMIASKGSNAEKVIDDYLKEWKGKTKEEFKNSLFKFYYKDNKPEESKIIKRLKEDKWFKDLGIKENDTVDEIKRKLEKQEFDKGVSKTACTNLLLLHNIDTVIQQNKKLVKSEDYGLPDSSRFPFHLYNITTWNIEHIRSNAGDNIANINLKKVFLGLKQCFLNKEGDKEGKLYKQIDTFINFDVKETDKFMKALENHYPKNSENEEFLKEIEELGKSREFKKMHEEVFFKKLFDQLNHYEEESINALPEDDKNKLWNFALLDSATNTEYQNIIFPLKREFIRLKEKGIKPEKYSEITWNNERKEIEIKDENKKDEVAFVPVCTRNVFAKFYTPTPMTMMSWTKKDAENYLTDIAEMLERMYNNKETS